MALVASRSLGAGEKLKPTALENASKVLNELLGFTPASQRLLATLRAKPNIHKGTVLNTQLTPFQQERAARNEAILYMFQPETQRYI